MARLSLGLVLATASARGDAIQPWSGASASAGPNSQSGATASASDSWSRTIEYDSAYSPGRGGYFVNAQGTSSAGAGGSADSLLRVDTSASIGNPGTTGRQIPGGSAEASASWTNDAVLLTSPAGQALPDMVRLNFSLTFNPSGTYLYPYDTSYGNSTLRANDKSTEIRWADSLSPGYDPGFFDTIRDGPGGMVGRFHLDLHVNEAGVSDPFSLLLEATSPATAGSNTPSWSFHHDVLALTGVSLPDGTSLAEAGYGVAFASGLDGPRPVPEPASAAFWVAITVAGAWAARRRPSASGR